MKHQHKNSTQKRLMVSLLALTSGFAYQATAQSADIIHDAEHYVLEAQHGDKWALEDADIQEKLAALEAKHGTKPNIIHIMWDDTGVGEIGIPEIQSVRGFETPFMNQMADEGINFMRMYSEIACTQTRAAFQTGRYAVRSGMHSVAFPVESSGMDAEEVTIAELLSDVGYKTAFYGKWHLGDTEPSYAHNQGYDEAFFTPYNQVPSMWVAGAELNNVVTGLFPEFYGEDKYDIDSSWQPNGYVWTLEGTKGGETLEWGPPPTVTNFWDIETEAQRRTLAFIDKSVEANQPFFIAYQPIALGFIPDPRDESKLTANKNVLQEALVKIDTFVGELFVHLDEKGISDNTLGYRDVRQWPVHSLRPTRPWLKRSIPVVKVTLPKVAFVFRRLPNGKVLSNLTRSSGDILHVTDLYTTFARHWRCNGRDTDRSGDRRC